MKNSNHKAIAIVGVGAIMPDAIDLNAFWNNIKNGRYSISDVPKGRWDPDLYYDPDPKAPDKTYSRIGGWVREWNWDPLAWRLPIPPKVSNLMDMTQIMAISASGKPCRISVTPKNNSTPNARPSFWGMPWGAINTCTPPPGSYTGIRKIAGKIRQLLGYSDKVKREIFGEARAHLDQIFPAITEDTMPGELSNIVAGRIAALYNFHGPNYVTDAACASAMAAMTAAVEGLEEYDYDVVITGGVDANMSPTTL